MMLVCLECPGEQACALNMPDDRAQFPIFCTPDTQGRIRQPKWLEVPPKENIYQDPLDREEVNEVLNHQCFV